MNYLTLYSVRTIFWMTSVRPTETSQKCSFLFISTLSWRDMKGILQTTCVYLSFYFISPDNCIDRFFLLFSKSTLLEFGCVEASCKLLTLDNTIGDHSVSCTSTETEYSKPHDKHAKDKRSCTFSSFIYRRVPPVFIG